MTISSTTNTVSYTGTGSATSFAVTYVFFGTGTTAEIEVVEVVIATGAETVKSNGSDFTVSGGSGATGTVTAAVAPANTVKWVINRATTQTQETDYVENDPFPAESHEEALDRLTAIAQEEQRALDRTAQLPDGYTGSFDPTLPTVITGSTVLAFNAAATAFEVGPTTTAISGAAAAAAAAAVSATDSANSATASAASAATASAYAGTQTVDLFNGTGSQTAFTLSVAPANGDENNTDVHISGVYQQKNTYAVSGTTLTFSTAPPAGTGNVEVMHMSSRAIETPADGSVTYPKFASGLVDTDLSSVSGSDDTIASAKAIKTYVDAQVDTVDTLAETLAIGNTTGGTDLGVSTGDDITFADSSKAIFGAGSDLKVWHDSANSYIQNITGTLNLQGKSGENSIVAAPDGAVSLYYDNAYKFATTATGVDVTGTIVGDGLTLTTGATVTTVLDEDNMASNSATALSTQQSIKAYVDAQVDTVDTLAEVLAIGSTTGGTDLGVSAGDDVTFTDSSKAIFGAGGDLQIYHEGSSSFIKDAGTGPLHIASDDSINITNAAVDENKATFETNGAVTLYYDNAVKLATAATGVTMTGEVTATGFTGTLDGILGSGTPAAATVTTLTTSGDVGIGEAAPAQRLEVTETDATGFTGVRINNPNGNVGSAGVEFQVDTTYAKAAIFQTRKNANGNGDLIFAVDTNADAANWVAADEKLRINTNGNLQVAAGNLLFDTAAKGVYLGVTSATAANLLDDYEEGDWTPTIGQGATASSDATYNGSFTAGKYTKIGRIVHCSATLRLTDKGTQSGAISITGLPFASANNVGSRATWSFFFHGAADIDLTGNVAGTIMMYHANNASNIIVRVKDPATAAAENVEFADISDTVYVQISGSYVAA
mgnify:CR=1 FL=1